jgi:hypothetical protein
MRKHRLYGVVIAVLLGMGVTTHHPSASHHAAGTDPGRTGITLISTVKSGQTSIAPTLRFIGFTLRGGPVPPDDTMVGLQNVVLPPPPPAPTPPAPAVASPPRPVAGSSLDSGAWASLRRCESGGNYGDNTGNGYYGAYQFTAGTWHSLGLAGLPSDAAPAVQDHAAQVLQARSGWGQWPACSRALGL